MDQTQYVAPTVSIPTGLDFTPGLTEFTAWWAAHYPTIAADVKFIVGIAIGISIPLSLFFLIVIIYSVEMTKRLRDKEAAMHEPHVEVAFETVETPPGDALLAQRWQSVVDHMSSDKENDWRQAIIDADIMLDDILNKLGYRGESVGEKLDRVEAGDFLSLNEAREAHHVRNRIAHGGSEFALTHHEAQRVFHLYKKVFEEFYYI